MVYQSIKTLLDAGVNAQNIFYVSLETPIYTGLPLEKLLGHFQEKFDHGRDAELYVYFDEVQYLPSWEIHL
jgi:predicted AAA+ superfamily ATPase